MQTKMIDLTFVSVLKICLAPNLIGWAVIAVVVGVAEVFGLRLLDILGVEDGMIFGIIKSFIIGVVFGAIGSLPFLLGIVLLRMVKRGPKLEFRSNHQQLHQTFE